MRWIGLGALSALELTEPVIRYERVAQGELIHLDIKRWASSPSPGTG